MKDSTRFFDIVIASKVLLVLSPLLVVTGILIKLSSKGPVLFTQKRVGRNNKDFTLYKFRTMRTGEPAKSRLTVGKDNRITGIGFWLRKYKLDELPQLWNVVRNEMSIVGPRPELRYYVDKYTPEQLQVLLVKPGITDEASIQFKNESELLAAADDPEALYIKEIMPFKIRLNYQYIQNKNAGAYFLIIFKTLLVLGKK